MDPYFRFRRVNLRSEYFDDDNDVIFPDPGVGTRRVEQVQCILCTCITPL